VTGGVHNQSMDDNSTTDRHDLTALGEELLAQAADSPHGRASRAVIHGDRQRAVLMAFKPGSALGEHEAPPAATLQVLRGRALLRAGDREWDLGSGELVPIPQSRHSLEVADEDAVVLLTVAVD
jgi:quercetin dioxygenase-like cupin family protein